MLGFTVLGGIERLEEALNRGAAGVVLSTDIDATRFSILERICAKQGVPLNRMRVRLQAMTDSPQSKRGPGLDQAQVSTPPMVSPPTTKPRLH